MKYFMLLFFLTLGMGKFGYTLEPVIVTEANNNLVTFHGNECVFQKDNEENWRKGDRAQALIKDGELMEVRWIR